jgi:hypothetical protein
MIFYTFVFIVWRVYCSQCFHMLMPCFSTLLDYKILALKLETGELFLLSRGKLEITYTIFTCGHAGHMARSSKSFLDSL